MSLLERVSEPVPGADLVDRYVEFVAARCRPNTVIATVSDLRVFFSVIDRSPVEVTTADVFAFIAAQRRGPGDGHVVRLADGEAGLAARTIKRRLASVSGLFNYLVLTVITLDDLGDRRDEQHAVVAVRAVDRPADRNAVTVRRDRPFPATLAPVGGVRAGPLTTERRLVLAAVNRDFGEVQANDPVVAGEGFVA